MANLAEIVLPAEKLTVDVCDIPDLFAKAIYPGSPSDAYSRRLAKLRKCPLDAHGVASEEAESLTEDPADWSPEERLLYALDNTLPDGTRRYSSDWDLLNHIWAALPAFQQFMPEAEWAAYAEAFENSPLRPAWRLDVAWGRQSLHTEWKQLQIFGDYEKEVLRAIRAKEIVPRSKQTFLPHPEAVGESLYEADSFISVDDLRAYAARFNVGVKVSEREGVRVFEAMEPMLEGYFNQPLSSVPGDLLTKAAKIDFLDVLWDKLGPRKRRELVAGWDYRHDPANAPEFRREWWDGDMDATLWWQRAAVKPHEAAALLCCHNPLTMEPDAPETNSNDKTGPADFKRLLRVFEDAEHTQPQHRPLGQWLSIARANRLKYHSWIDEWLADGPDKLDGPTPPETTGAPKAASPISRARAQDEAILAEIRICNYDPLKLPKAPAGKAGVKAEIRKRLILRTDTFVSSDVFDDAWQRLRDQADIRDA